MRSARRLGRRSGSPERIGHCVLVSSVSLQRYFQLASSAVGKLPVVAGRAATLRVRTRPGCPRSSPMLRCPQRPGRLLPLPRPALEEHLVNQTTRAAQQGGQRRTEVVGVTPCPPPCCGWPARSRSRPPTNGRSPPNAASFATLHDPGGQHDLTLLRATDGPASASAMRPAQSAWGPSQDARRDQMRSLRHCHQDRRPKRGIRR